MHLRSLPCFERVTSVSLAHSQRHAFGGALIAAAILLTASPKAKADGPRTPGRYTPPPVGSYILQPGEIPIQLRFGDANLSDIQAQLNAARAANSDSPIVLTLTGTYQVKNAPLSLPSKTSLVLYGEIDAAPGATAPSLISVSGQTRVAIAGGLLDGESARLTAIDVESSTKVNIDAVTVSRVNGDGIVLSGAGNTVFDSGSAITRCDVSHVNGNGITVDAITQALLLDNYVHDNTGTGIQFSAAHSSLVNNASRHNSVGIYADGTYDLIADNDASGNTSTGVQLSSSTSNVTVLRNTVANNQEAGVDFDGSNNLLYSNTLSNPMNLVDRSTVNWVVPREAPLQANSSQYFYPPTIDNQHTDPVMHGLGRTDVTVTSEDLTAVQQAYDAARQQNPTNFIVLHMNGDFTADTAPLTLSSDSAVVLNGTIHLTASLTNVIAATNPASFVSISGGTIDLAGFPIEAVHFPSAQMINIDHLTVLNGGLRDHRTSKSMIHQVSNGGYNILYRNTVNQAGGRCLWTQSSSSHYVVLENTLSNCNMDAVDFDSSTSNSYAIDNVALDNLRYGVFVEQSDSYDTVYGTFTTTRDVANTGHGVGVYNNATSSSRRAVTDGNTVFSNTSDIINNGLRLGSVATATGGVGETAHTFMFNNIALNSRSDGILFDPQFPGSVQNYFSQTILAGNGTDLSSVSSNGAEPPEFFNPVSATDLALNKPVTVSSTAPGSDPEAAVDGLSFTGWATNNEPQSWLTVDLGAAATIQRVTLKRAQAEGVFVVKLETSTDGSTFTNIPYTLTTAPGSVNMLTFAPVTARFVRVTLRNPAGNTLQEIAISPE